MFLSTSVGQIFASVLTLVYNQFPLLKHDWSHLPQSLMFFASIYVKFTLLTLAWKSLMNCLWFTLTISFLTSSHVYPGFKSDSLLKVTCAHSLVFQYDCSTSLEEPSSPYLNNKLFRYQDCLYGFLYSISKHFASFLNYKFKMYLFKKLVIEIYRGEISRFCYLYWQIEIIME